MAQPERDITLSVFMEGTSNPMDRITTQIALFSRICTAQSLPEGGEEVPKLTPGHYKLSFPGCGVSHGIRGLLFACGLREQCEVVRGYVESCVEAGQSVTVNFVGLSRGGIGGLYLAQMLASFDVAKVKLNLLLFDPVPGNLVWMSRFFDLAGVMNANQAMDVSFVKNFGRVVVLYPHEPLPAIAVHAPLLAKFPHGCQLEQDVILGCHQGALWLRAQPDTCLAFSRIRDFLLQCGSHLDRSNRIARELDVPNNKLAEMLAMELQQNSPTTRCAHAPESGTQIVRYTTGQFLNRSHQALLQRLRKPHEANPSLNGPIYMLGFAMPT